MHTHSYLDKDGATRGLENEDTLSVPANNTPATIRMEWGDTFMMGVTRENGLPTHSLIRCKTLQAVLVWVNLCRSVFPWFASQVQSTVRLNIRHA